MEMIDSFSGEIKEFGGYVRVCPYGLPLVFGGTGNMLVVLLRCMRYNSNVIYINGKLREECEEAGICRTAMYRYLRNLEEAGLVTRERGRVVLSFAIFNKGNRYRYQGKRQRNTEEDNFSE